MTLGEELMKLRREMEEEFLWRKEHEIEPGDRSRLRDRLAEDRERVSEDSERKKAKYARRKQIITPELA